LLGYPKPHFKVVRGAVRYWRPQER
jgi:hypothetical protein